MRNPSNVPILFGSAKRQQLLLEMYKNGYVQRPGRVEQKGLLKSGLICRVNIDGRICYALETRHPRYTTFQIVLFELAGTSQAEPPNAVLCEQIPVHPEAPLAHDGRNIFQVLFRVAQANGEIAVKDLTHRTYTAASIQKGLGVLVRWGILTKSNGTCRIAPGVPAAYRDLVIEIATDLIPVNPVYGVKSEKTIARVAAFVSNPDGAPRLFGTDIRLRNLMALAKHGPLAKGDLRLAVGATAVRLESYDFASCGRGAVVREWQLPDGSFALALDPAYPLAKPLKALLLKMEQKYPLPPLVRRYPIPKMPARKKWRGDKTALFGDDIPTTILVMTGVRGWIFEALCDAIITHDRFNIKRSMKRLEKEGVLTSDRPRRPGFDVRAVTISPKFVAAEELAALIRAYLKVWPNIRTRTEREIKKLGSKTLRHLENRGLIPCKCCTGGVHTRKKRRTAAGG